MNIRKEDLVATYEEVLNIPSEQCMTSYFGDYGMHFKKDTFEGFKEDLFEARFQEALSILGVSEQEFLNNRDFIYRGNIKMALENSYAQKNKPSLQNTIDVCEASRNSDEASAFGVGSRGFDR